MHDSEHWLRVWELFDRIVELPSAQHADALRELEADEAVRAEVAALLRANDNHGESTPAADGSEQAPRLPPGTRIGCWQAQSLLGRGGMGEVYLSHRVGNDFQQRAALKLLMAFDSAEDRARFAAERRILARLEHPGIAHLLDGGEHEGMPYAVMEYVEGVTLTAHARALPLAARLELMLQACAAVSHAHQHLIIHRDLKPANMLVTPEGRLKLLDFGIAKRLSPLSREAEEATQVIRASPDYCAPEQLSGEPVSTATDVYALGVVLYEILAGQRPWQLGGLPIIRAMERLSLQDPIPPSKRLTGIEQHAVRGDLDSIVLKAMQVNPQHRYPTVDALADDLRAHLEQRPVKARNATFGYLLARRLQRHRTAFALAGALFASLAIGLVALTLQTRETAMERDNARREAARNDAVRQYLSLMFRSASERQANDEVSARDVLNEAAQRIHEQFADDPDSRADISLSLAELYFQLNDYTGARPLLEQLLDEGKDVRADVRAMAMHDLAQVNFRENHKADAAELLHQAQAYWMQEPGFEPQLLDSRLLQAQIEQAQGDPQRALATLKEALPLRIALSGRENRDTAVLINNLGSAHYQAGEFEEAVNYSRQANAIWAALGQDRSADALNTLNNWAGAEVQLGHADRAVDIFRRALTLRRDLYGPSAALAALINNLGKTLNVLGNHLEALPLLHEAMAMATEHAGGDANTITLSAGLGLVDALAATAQPLQAQETLDWLQPRIIDNYGEQHPLAAMLEVSRARALHAAGKTTEARQALALATQLVEALGPAGKRALEQIRELEQQWNP
ncbi:MAG TPA: serine/threonine-protein kinase [Lysobacter sp.]|nr:serine/threonine-protein kinase [Lysobacter sp.]